MYLVKGGENLFLEHCNFVQSSFYGLREVLIFQIYGLSEVSVSMISNKRQVSHSVALIAMVYNYLISSTDRSEG